MNVTGSSSNWSTIPSGTDSVARGLFFKKGSAKGLASLSPSRSGAILLVAADESALTRRDDTLEKWEMRKCLSMTVFVTALMSELCFACWCCDSLRYDYRMYYPNRTTSAR